MLEQQETDQYHLMSAKVDIISFVIVKIQQMLHFVMELIDKLLNIIIKLIEDSMKSGDKSDFT